MRSIIITAITLFALSGAILGFAVGAFTHTRQNPPPPVTKQQPVTKPSPTVTPTQTPTTTTTAVATAQKICAPELSYTTSSGTGTAIVYTFTAQAEAEATGCAAITASGITTRLWLIKNGTPNIKQSALENPPSLSDPTNFPNEVVGGLQFNGTPQVQTTNSNGIVTWNVTISPSLAKGSYRVAALSDWNGTFYNWGWVGFPVGTN